MGSRPLQTVSSKPLLEITPQLEEQFDLERFYPEKVEGTIPTIAEIEAKLGEDKEG